MAWWNVYKIWFSEDPRSDFEKTNIDYENTELAKDSLEFIRKFRWTIESNDGLYPQFIKNVNISWMSNSISIEMHEPITCDGNGNKYVQTLAWAEDHLKDDEKVFELKFTTFNGFGEEIYVQTFSNCFVASMCPKTFDYCLSKESTIVVGVEFGDWETTFK